MFSQMAVKLTEAGLPPGPGEDGVLLLMCSALLVSHIVFCKMSCCRPCGGLPHTSALLTCT